MSALEIGVTIWSNHLQSLMRGADTFTESLFSFAKLEEFVPANHPLRSIRTMANMALVNAWPFVHWHV